MRLIWLSLTLMFLPIIGFACGDGERCSVTGGYYLASEPKDWDGKTPLRLVVYFHGWNGSPEGTFRNRGMVRAVNESGALFIAPFVELGYWKQIGRGRAEQGRDEERYIRAVMKNARQRWPIDEDQTLASGFSRGASMVWNVACYAGDLFRAYAPIAGGFWRSTPDTCQSGPINMRHIHGLSDRVVAFDNIGIHNSMPIPEGLEVFSRINGVSDEGREVASGDKRLTCERWDQSQTGRVLELCLHERGHSIPSEWVAAGLDWLAELPDGSQ